MKTPLLLALALLLLLALGFAWRSRLGETAAETAVSPPRSQPDVETRAPALEAPAATLVDRTRSQEEHPVSTPPQGPVPTPEPRPDESLGLEELMRETRLVGDRLREATQPLLRAQIDSGRAEFLGDSSTVYHSRPGDNEEIFNITNFPDRGMYRPSLSREEYPDLYELKDRFVRLNKLIARREVEAARAR